MYAIIGIIVLLVMVFGGFMLSGGALGPVMAAMPYEMLIIGGAAAGALVAGNSLDGLKALGTAMGKIFKGPKHDKQDHVDAIALTTQLMRMLKNDGPVALESHLEDPANSTVFSAYPNLLKNEALIALICDTLTLLVVSSGTLETHAVEEVMDNAMKTHFHEMHEPQHNLQTLSDALPALGIVAAVLGVVKTMGSIDKPPEILGKMIGAALVGTFLGVLLAYGIVGPLAGRLKQVLEQDEQIFHAVKQVIIASLYGHPQPLVVESARSGLGHTVRPGLNELLDALRGR
ncbi:MAG TPA: flagellar motor stator protein MotA [Erythrobacter sp.]|jgi:chemotaxis protein MotA|uniref:Flagellar motor protein n=5 Tax=Erythrobacteraceae TaxID=335929 RepID=A0A0L1KI35_9SPHN|nr:MULTISPECIES: flagellar motor stator protein MotA [Erythrobacteraceae]MAC31821.1 flagellar motor stator protein MotA [Erythrobacter sp.]MAG05991.1 flagellar motor stator protein MotA [Sphingomonadaceae bacterium]MBN91936.1 flagellar motor stator protein MotA [Erythrobacteraceae bacterium]MCZ4264927.1 flagellar motor stator protein MotA [Erythrobacter sp. G21629-S1]KNH03494.1 flagellar motor protein [Qipengyuania citrea LAMA 915]|tara:strand:+ start:1608 stop:2471 length:864 start_codon:yes stop_codon:yes gene_type:complete